MADAIDKEKTRKSYRREFKLNVIKWFYDNGKNVAHTAVRFKVHRKQIRNWIRDELKIKESKEKSQKIKSGRTAAYPDAEKALFAEFL